jgi:hypothetical protein
MNNLLLFLSFLNLYTEVFIFNQLWLVAIGAILVIILSKFLFSSESNAVFYELSNAVLIWTAFILVLFGVYLLYNICRVPKHFIPFTASFSTISSRILLAIILDFFFMESFSGFGIPILLIVALIIIALFKRFTALILSLATNSTLVLFAALETSLALELGINAPEKVVIMAIILNTLPALLLLFMLTDLLLYSEELKITWKKEWKMLLRDGISFYVPFASTTLFLIEFPSVVAGLFGLLLFVFIFVPTIEIKSGRIWWNAFFACFFFMTLLLIRKFANQDTVISFASVMKQVALFQIGIVFIIVMIGVLFVMEKGHLGKHFLSLGKVSLLKIGLPTITLLVLISFTQLIAKSISEQVSALTVSIYHFWQIRARPIIGVSSTFITRSLGAVALAQQPLFTSLLYSRSAVDKAISLQNSGQAKSVIAENSSASKILKFNLLIAGNYFALVFVLLLILIR